eukprot:jgi/Chrpa1/20247/Chrysochromulina_OHIO_Genome00022457-RA
MLALWFIVTATTASQFTLQITWTAGAPGFVAVATTDLAEGPVTFNPLPFATGALCTGTKDAPPNGDAFFCAAVTCKGAFGSSTDNWLAGYSLFACNGKMVGSSCTSSAARAALQSTGTLLPSTLVSNTVLAAIISYFRASQVFVQSGVTLTIPAGTNIVALPVPTGVAAPALVVVKGGVLDGMDLIGQFGSFIGEEIRTKDITGTTCTNGCKADGELGRLLTTTFMPSDYVANACGTQICEAWQIAAGNSAASFECVFYGADFSGGGDEVYNVRGHPECGYATMVEMSVNCRNCAVQFALTLATPKKASVGDATSTAETAGGAAPWGSARNITVGCSTFAPCAAAIPIPAIWLAGYSLLVCTSKMAGSTCSGVPASIFAPLGSSVVAIGGTLTSSLALVSGTSYLLTSQLFVSSGHALNIFAGTTVYALPAASPTSAPAIVVLKGGYIVASGSATMPITFTTVLAEAALVSSATAPTDSNYNAITLGERGKWGGLILLGNAPTNMATTMQIEGITGYTYGGTVATESSGLLQYVRVWHGGAIVGANNEINGITFGGVGSGTTVAYCEVA